MLALHHIRGFAYTAYSKANLLEGKVADRQKKAPVPSTFVIRKVLFLSLPVVLGKSDYHITNSNLYSVDLEVWSNINSYT